MPPQVRFSHSHTSLVATPYTTQPDVWLGFSTGSDIRATFTVTVAAAAPVGVHFIDCRLFTPSTAVVLEDDCFVVGGLAEKLLR